MIKFVIELLNFDMKKVNFWLSFFEYVVHLDDISRWYFFNCFEYIDMLMLKSFSKVQKISLTHLRS